MTSSTLPPGSAAPMPATDVPVVSVFVARECWSILTPGEPGAWPAGG
jgi:hypothetical protein